MYLSSRQKPWESTSSRPFSIERTLTQSILSIWNALPTQLRPQFPKLIGAGMEMAWYTVAMRKLPVSDTMDMDRVDVGSGLGAIVRMWLYVAPGPWTWRYWCILTFCVAVLAYLLHHIRGI